MSPALNQNYWQSSSAPSKSRPSSLITAPTTGGGVFEVIDLSQGAGMPSAIENYIRNDLSFSYGLWVKHIGGVTLYGTGAVRIKDMFPVEMTPLGEIKSEAPKSPKDIVALLRKTFALNMSQLAKILRVERPTAYAWASLEDPSKIREATRRQRLRDLLAITKQWMDSGLLAQASLELPLADGRTMLELLSAETLDPSAIMNAHTQLTEREAEIRARSEARTRGFADAIAASLRDIGKPAAGG